MDLDLGRQFITVQRIRIQHTAENKTFKGQNKASGDFQGTSNAGIRMRILLDLYFCIRTSNQRLISRAEMFAVLWTVFGRIRHAPIRTV